MALNLEELWKSTLSDIGVTSGKGDEWFSKIIRAYADDQRHYQNVQNLEHKFKNFEMIKSSLKNKNAMALALFFHYYEYDPKLVDYFKKNIEHFTKFSDECKIPTESDLFKDVVKMLEAVDTHSTDEHKTDGVYGSDDCHYFLDLDIAILGSDPEHYADYATRVQREYSFLPSTMYQALRLKVLQNFLQIPNIYATKEFREKYENQARTNIKSEVNKLK
ncbi:uncharacterized protein LOC142322291 [Lycorma delicatula]|uniref:uncharacterized protein LOC142322291 n=1 Tax=Lycorma delicatula TaxID=130591 RepID=UPI003F515D40